MVPLVKGCRSTEHRLGAILKVRSLGEGGGGSLKRIKTNRGTGVMLIRTFAFNKNGKSMRIIKILWIHSNLQQSIFLFTYSL